MSRSLEVSIRARPDQAGRPGKRRQVALLTGFQSAPGLIRPGDMLVHRLRRGHRRFQSAPGLIRPGDHSGTAANCGSTEVSIRARPDQAGRPAASPGVTTHGSFQSAPGLIRPGDRRGSSGRRSSPVSIRARPDQAGRPVRPRQIGGRGQVSIRARPDQAGRPVLRQALRSAPVVSIRARPDQAGRPESAHASADQVQFQSAPGLIRPGDRGAAHRPRRHPRFNPRPA